MSLSMSILWVMSAIFSGIFLVLICLWIDEVIQHCRTARLFRAIIAYEDETDLSVIKKIITNCRFASNKAIVCPFCMRNFLRIRCIKQNCHTKLEGIEKLNWHLTKRENCLFKCKIKKICLSLNSSLMDLKKSITTKDQEEIIREKIIATRELLLT